MKKIITFSALSLMTLFTACTSHPPLPNEDFVDIDAFMGPWFVQGYTPILVDGEAHNAVEHYFKDESGKIFTTYQFRDESFKGELKTYKPTGFVQDDGSNAIWKMQFFWPFKADYVIVYLDEKQGITIIGHPNRKYAWIMTRDTQISDLVYSNLIRKLNDLNFDVSKIKRLPHDWSLDQERLNEIISIGSSAPLEKR